MKKLWLISTLALSIILLSGCTNDIQENIEPAPINWDNTVQIELNVVDEENNTAEDTETVDGQPWTLMAFNGKEIDWNYTMTIKDNKELYIKFCNNIWWDVVFDWNEKEWIISASLTQTEMACEWESMDLENAFHIDWAQYKTITNEDGWATMIITTTNWDKFYWRAILD